MSLSIADVLIGHDAIESFSGRVAEKLVRQGEMFFGPKTEEPDNPHHFGVGALHAPADGLFLFGLKQGNSANLGQIATEQIIDRFTMLIGLGSFMVWPR
jgi:hypothetical protein